MLRSNLLITAAAIATLALAGCAGSSTTEARTGAMSAESTTTAPAARSSESAATTTAPAATAQPAVYSDAQVAAYVAASAEASPIIRALGTEATAEQRTQAGEQIGAILTRHNLDYATYNGIAERSRTDQTLANRIAVTRVGNVTDTELRAFISASAEVDPITRSLANATPEQRTQGAEQIRSILAQHNLDTTTYNGIAARAQSDTAFAARLSAIRQAQPEG